MPSEGELAKAILEGVLVADGAMGTMLQAAGLPAGTPPELWNEENPTAVLAVHRAYVEAGADLLLTNTFGANRLKLSRYGLAEQVGALCRRAATIARQAAGPGRFVLGDLGPTGLLLEPYGQLTEAEARAAFAEQARALAEGGVDAILVETMADPAEARAAIAGAHEGCDLPVICTFSFDRGRRTMMGAGAQALAALWGEGLLCIGANCGYSLEDTLAVIKELHSLLPEAPLVAKPNAGVPRLGEDGQTHFDVGPAEMARFVPEYLAAGVRIIGGCCGSTPEHIAAIALAVREHFGSLRR
jgi:5-methyltetrahydrofolate--homocysteine methyltransferase